MREPQEIDFFTRSDIDSSICRVEELLACGIFERGETRHPLFKSAFGELVILVRDLVKKSERFAEGVSFTDDVNIVGRVSDVSGAIAYVRDCFCHVDSSKHFVDERAKFSFNVIGGAGSFGQFGGAEMRSDYADDLCFFYGTQRLYLRRHLIRAFEEAKAQLLPLVSDDFGRP